MIHGQSLARFLAEKEIPFFLENRLTVKINRFNCYKPLLDILEEDASIA